MREEKRMKFETVTGLCCHIKPKHMVLSAVYQGLGGLQIPALAGMEERTFTSASCRSLHGCKPSSELGWDQLGILCLPACPPSCRVKKCRHIFYLLDTWIPYQVTLKSSETSKRAESVLSTPPRHKKVLLQHPAAASPACCLPSSLFLCRAGDMVMCGMKNTDDAPLIPFSRATRTHPHTHCFLPSPCLLCQLNASRELRTAENCKGFAALVDI